MKPSFLWMIALGVTLGAGGRLSAATYNVNNQSPHASDKNPGTVALPLKTISAASRRVKPGDTVLVWPGTYREAVTLTVSGKRGKPITFKSKVSHQAIIDGADVITKWHQVAPGVWSIPSRVRKIPYGFGNGQWVYINGEPLERAKSRQLLLPGQFYQDFSANRLFVRPPQGRDINKEKVEFARREGLIWPARPLDDIHIIGFTLTHDATWFRGKSAITISGRRWLVENNQVLWSSYRGVGMEKSNDATVRNNLIEWSGDEGIGGASNIHMDVEGNRILYNNWRRIKWWFEGGGSKWAFTYDSVIRDNEFAYNDGAGIWFDTANGGDISEHNAVHDNTGPGLFPEVSWQQTIRDNIAYNNGVGLCVGETPATLVQRNIIFNNGIGIRMRGNYRRSTVHKRLSGYRKRLANIPGLSSRRRIQLEAQYEIYFLAPASFMLNNGFIHDNIVFDNHINYYEFRHYGSPSAVAGFVNNFSDNNIFWAPKQDGSFRYHYEQGKYASFAQWQKLSKRDAHSQWADPTRAATRIPLWAQAKRSLWSRHFRSWQSVVAMKLGVIHSPSACVLRGRIFRSPVVEPFKLSDPRVKGLILNVDGQRTIALWTTQMFQRVPVRLNVGKANVVVEDGYLVQHPQRTVAGTVAVIARFLPIYIHGIAGHIVQESAAVLSVPRFNAPDATIPAKLTITNHTNKDQVLHARFAVSKGYRLSRSTIEQKLKPSQTAMISLRLVPEGSMRRGMGQLRLQGRLGQERITCLALFAVGKSAGTIHLAAHPPQLDGRMQTWPDVPLATISDVNQFANGNRSLWKGPKDLSGKLYGVWTRHALYLAAVVTDNAVMPAPPSGEPWNYDSVEFFVDGRRGEMQWQKDLTTGCYQIAVSPGSNGHPVVKVLSPTGLTGLRTDSARTASGYIVQIRIPLSAENFPADGWVSGRSIKMSMLINDRDQPTGPRKYSFGWAFSPGGKNYEDTSGWKRILLKK